MKIIHCADLHLDSKMDTLPSDRSRKRREEVLHTFERLAMFAAENGVKAIIIAGDMFDTHAVSAKTRGRIIAAIKSVPDVDFLYLTGNHDEENFIMAAQDDAPLPENLKTFSDNWTYYDYGDITVGGIILTPNNARYVYDRLSLSENRLNIVALHGQIAGYKSMEKAETISLPLLKERNIDYLALGHIHSYAEGKLDDRGIYAYSGCLEGRGFDETGEKGFVLLESVNGKLTRSFVKFSSRELYDYEFDVSQYNDWYEARRDLILQISEKFSETSLIKVILTGSHSVDFGIDRSELAERLNERFFFGKVYDNTSLKVSAEDYAADKSVRGEFVRTVLGSGLKKEDADKVIMTGLNALRGEGL